MLRKLRRLRVPVCFYTCCSLCAILLFASFNEDVKSLIQQDNHERAGSSSAPHNAPSSFSSFSSSNTGDSHSVISSIPSSRSSNSRSESQSQQRIQSVQRRSLRQQQLPILPVDTNHVVPHLNEENDEDAIRQYINDNFIGQRLSAESETNTILPSKRPEQQPTTIVISNLVKLVQQSVPDATNQLGSDNELPQAFIETQGTTSDTDLLYPGGDANSQVRKRERHWFMTGGDYFPTPPGGLASIFYPSSSWLSSRPSNLEYANLWYDNNVGSDRVMEQLMYAIDDPINYTNISWIFEGLTATTAPPPTSMLTGGESSKSEKGAAAATISPPISDVADTNETAAYLYTVAYLQNSVQSHQQPSMNAPYILASGGTSPFRDPRLGKIKTILLYYGLGMSWGSQVTNGRQVFLQQRCPVNACRLTGNRAQLSKADIVVFKDVFMHPKVRRPSNQLWVMYMLECPLNTQQFLEKNVFNLTATYRHDSDIVTPYEKFMYFDDKVRSLPQAINYAEGKTKKVAWFVSNCVAKNNRLEYARELAKYIEVDIYGACGSHTCSRANARQCFEMLSTNYKFYLAFENSNCRDYITEKFFVNGLGNDVLPIVMGAHPDDYKRVAPDRSYIHVDDFSSPKELAQYLHELDTNDDLYNEYFKWKGTGEFINTHFFCRLCAMAHYSTRTPKTPSHYSDFNRWWRGPHVCTKSTWRSTPDIFAQENYGSIVSYL